jgi:prepilin-type N-terminal cleavage/methylation domain-containing protein
MTSQRMGIPSELQPARGFTLIEMMAALTLIGLIAGLMLPNFQRWHDSTQQRVTAGSIGMQLQKLHVRAALMGQEFELTTQNANTLLADGQAALQLPAGWKIADQQRLKIHASGYCTSATIDFRGPDARLRFAITAPQCNVTQQVIQPAAT